MAPDRIRLTVAEARRHSELALMGLGYDAEQAAITPEERARMEAEAKARLAETVARQQHERELSVIARDRGRRRLQWWVAGLGLLVIAVGAAGGVAVARTMEDRARAQAQTAELRARVDDAEDSCQPLAVRRDGRLIFAW